MLEGVLIATGFLMVILAASFSSGRWCYSYSPRRRKYWQDTSPSWTHYVGGAGLGLIVSGGVLVVINQIIGGVL